jgi:hypothetical protein
MDRFVIKNGSPVNISNFIRKGVLNGSISYEEVISKEGFRLDSYANNYYNDPSLWWVIAAASGIGWWLQIPSGVVLYIPVDLDQVRKIINLV